MKKILSLTLKIIFSIVVKGYSQQLPLLPSPKLPFTPVISTPDVMSFQKFGIIPVSLYNGKIDVVVPFYEINIGKIKIPINLTYNTSGIKVDEIASPVGLGWNLNAGGNILYSKNDIGDGALQYGFSELDPTIVGYDRKYVLKNPIFNSNIEWLTNVDSAPDFRYVNAPGLNNIFMINDSNPDDYLTSYTNRKYISKFLNPKGEILSEFKIENIGSFTGIGFTGEEDGNQSLNIPTKVSDVTIKAIFTVKNFIITNAEGLKYNFSVGNIIETRSLPVLVDPTEARLDPSYRFGINTYNLTSIYDPSTKQNVEFIYENYQITQAQRIRFSSKNNNVGNNDSCDFGFIPEYKGQPIYSNEMLIKYHTATRLKKITFSNGEVEFLYQNNREDYDDKSLDLIIIKDNKGSVIKSFRFKYSYFDSKEGCSQKECKRLRLDEINEEYSSITKRYFSFDYFYSNKLPKRFSYEQDFLGFYNNNGYQNSKPIEAKESGPQPKLYFYPNRKEFSILPFQRSNDNNGREIIGDYSLAPNIYSLTGLLKKVTYETKGFTEFKYENHTFNFDGAEYIAGGARIQSQIINDGKGNFRELTYKYVEKDGKSSGYIGNIPVFAYPNSRITNLNLFPIQWTPFSFSTFDYDKTGLDFISENFVGYSRVLEQETGNGITESIFHSFKDYPNVISQKQHRDDCGKYLIDNSNFPGILFEDKKSKRGTLNRKKTFDENGNLISEIENIYDYKIFSTINLKKYEPYKLPDSEYLTRIRTYNSFVEEISKMNIERNLLAKVISTEYFSTGNKVTEQFLTYDDNYPFIKEQRIIDAVGDLKIKNYFPFNHEIYPAPYMPNLVGQNRINELILQEIRKDNILINKSFTSYEDFGNEIILPKSVLTAKGSSNLEENIIIDKRDNNGNILQYHNQANVYTSFIWGYNQTQPIAKIENETYLSITPSLITTAQTKSDTGTEAELLTALTAIRTALPNAMVTTYTHKPLIGVSTITDPKGDKLTYEYDELNRLKQVKDKDGNILSENEYHYKN